MMPEEVRSRDPWLASTRKLVKENVTQKGEDAVLWGKWEESDLEEEKLEEACPRPVWSNSQMKRRGEPPKKKIRRDEKDDKTMRQVDKTGDEGNERGNKVGGTEEKKKKEMTMEDETRLAVVSRKEMAKRQAERREKLKVRREIRAKKKTEREARKREKEAKMIKAGEDKSKRQPKLRRWARGEGGLERERVAMVEKQTGKVQKKGGKKEVG